MQPTINIDTTNGMANVTMQNAATGAFISVHQLKLGATAHMTVAQVDAHARTLAKQALQAAAAAL